MKFFFFRRSILAFNCLLAAAAAAKHIIFAAGVAAAANVVEPPHFAIKYNPTGGGGYYERQVATKSPSSSFSDYCVCVHVDLAELYDGNTASLMNYDISYANIGRSRRCCCLPSRNNQELITIRTTTSSAEPSSKPSKKAAGTTTASPPEQELLFRKQNRGHREAGAGAGSGSASAAASNSNIARLAENLLYNPLNPGFPLNPPNSGGLARIRNTIKSFAGLTNDEKIAAICNLILDGHNNDIGDNGDTTDTHALIDEIQNVVNDRDDDYLGVYHLWVENKLNVINGEFSDVNLKRYRGAFLFKSDKKQLFVLDERTVVFRGALASTKNYKVYALFDPSDGLVYKLDIKNNVIKVLDADPFRERVIAYPSPDLVEVGTLHGGSTTAADVARIRTAAAIARSPTTNYRYVAREAARVAALRSPSRSNHLVGPSRVCNIMRRRRTLSDDVSRKLLLCGDNLSTTTTTKRQNNYSANSKMLLLKAQIRRMNSKKYVAAANSGHRGYFEKPSVNIFKKLLFRKDASKTTQPFVKTATSSF